MTAQAREQWTRGEALRCLDDIQKSLKELEAFSTNGGKMPAPVRRYLAVTFKRIKNTETKLRSWAITEKERNEAVAKKGGR